MDLSMAIRMKKHSVFCLVAASVDSPNDVVVVPAGEFGDFLVAEGADPVLLLP